MLKNPASALATPRDRVISSARPHSRTNTQAQPAARQARKEVKRERIKICGTSYISRLSRVSRHERSKSMRLASETTQPPAVPPSASMTRFFSNLLNPVVGSPDELSAVGSLQPAHDEVPASHVLKMIDEEEVYHGAPRSPQDRNRLGDRLLGNGHPKT